MQTRKALQAASLIGAVVLFATRPAIAVDAGAAGAAEITLEQQSADDLAERLAVHLRATADILASLAQAKDPAARRVEMERYARAMETTGKLDRAMQALSGAAPSAAGCAMMGGGMMGGAKAPQAKRAPAPEGESASDHNAHH